MSVERLFHAPAEPAELLIRGAHALDPRSGLDAPLDVLVIGGKIRELGDPGTIPVNEGIEVIAGEGLHLFPAFFDPHVHLRTPGQEHKETLATGTASAAAGGYCGIVAMPNTTPTLDDASGLQSLRAQAAPLTLSGS